MQTLGRQLGRQHCGSDCPCVLVTGILTQTLVPHEAISRAWRLISVEVVGEDLERDGRSVTWSRSLRANPS